MENALRIPELVLLIASQATDSTRHELAKTSKHFHTLLHRYLISTVTINNPGSTKTAMTWLRERLSNPIILHFDMDHQEWMRQNMDEVTIQIYRMLLSGPMRGPMRLTGLVLSASTTFSPSFASIAADLFTLSSKLTIVMPEDFVQASLDGILPTLLYFVDHTVCFQYASAAITIFPADKLGRCERDVHITSTDWLVVGLLTRLINASLEANVYLESEESLVKIDLAGFEPVVKGHRREGAGDASDGELEEL